MNSFELIGNVYPWPGEHIKRPDGWSWTPCETIPKVQVPHGWLWGFNETIAKIRSHKSRLILQADALASLRDATVSEKILKHALYSGAAEWELWLLKNGDQSLKHELKSCAHSAVSLAKLSGDVGLVGRILEEWEKRGTPRAVFANDAREWVKTQTPIFYELLMMLQNKYGSNIMEPASDPATASAVLDGTEWYAEQGGPVEIVEIRERALETLGGATNEVLNARFLLCVGRPTNPDVAYSLLHTARRLRREGDLPANFFETSKWFAESLVLQAGLLDLAREGGIVSWLGHSTLAQEKIVERLARNASKECKFIEIEWAFATCAKALADHGQLTEAYSLLTAAVVNHPKTMKLRVVAAYYSHKLGHHDALNELRAFVRDESLTGFMPVFWLVVAAVFTVAAEWSDAILAFRRGGIDDATFDEPLGLYQYAVALAQSGDVYNAKAILRRVVAIAPADTFARQYLATLDGGTEVAAIVPQPSNDPCAPLFRQVETPPRLPWLHEKAA